MILTKLADEMQSALRFDTGVVMCSRCGASTCLSSGAIANALGETIGKAR